MNLPEFMSVRYDPRSLKTYLDIDMRKYFPYHLKGIERELTDTVEQNEIKTGIQLMFKMMKIVSSNPLLHLQIEDHYFSYSEYRYYCEKYFNIKAFAREDMECFWFVLSRYYPFTDEEIQEYMQYLNYNELQKNSFVIVPEDVMESIKLLNDLH